MGSGFSTVSVIGLGYIGLPTAAIFAKHGLHVTGVDVNQRVVETINEGRIHIVEPELASVVSTAVRSGKLRAVVLPEPAEAFVIAVPTPFTNEHKADLNFIKAASRSIAPVLAKGNLVVLESTSPVGATEQMAAWLSELRPDLTFPQQHGDAADIQIAFCPERVLPGNVMYELVHNDRVVGGMSEIAAKKAEKLYRVFVKGDCLLTNSRTAEMAKLAENAFRDVNIAFANELSLVCDHLDINVWELISIANHHPRVNILRPGAGVGGHCIAVDPWFIIASCPEKARLIRAAREVNDSKPMWVGKKIEEAVELAAIKKGVAKSEVTVAFLGLAFKPDIDDFRESPAVSIACRFAARHSGNTLVVEPNIMDYKSKKFSSLVPFSNLLSLGSALEQSDVVVLLVAHKEFKEISQAQLAGKLWIDVCGLIDGW